MAIEQIRGYIAEHKIGTAIASAALVIGIGAAGLNGCSDNSNERSEFEGPSQEEIAGYCDTDGWAVSEYQAKIGNNAALPLEALAGNDVPAIRDEAAKDIASNDFGLAVASTLIDYKNQPVNFADIQGRMETTLDVISKDDEKRTEVCEEVVSEFVRNGDRVEIKGNSYLEASPVYDGEDLNTKSVKFNGNRVTPNDGVVAGFWVKTEQGELPVVMTADGRVLVPETVGTEQNTTTLDPNGEPTVTVNEDGQPIEAKLLPNGQVEITNLETGEVTIAPAGPNGTIPEAGPGGVTPSPANGGGTTIPTPGTTPATPTTQPHTTTTRPPQTTTTQPPQTTTTRPPQTTTTTRPPQTTTTTTPKGPEITIPGAPN